MSLENNKIMAFAATTNTEAARYFYEKRLGLKLIEDSEYAIVYDAGGTMLRVRKAQKLAPPQLTLLGWQVDDIAAKIGKLTARGVVFNQYGMDFIPQDELGIWTTPDGSA